MASVQNPWVHPVKPSIWRAAALSALPRRTSSSEMPSSAWRSVIVPGQLVRAISSPRPAADVFPDLFDRVVVQTQRLQPS